MAQRLVITIDVDEKYEYQPSVHELNRINISKNKNVKFYKGKILIFDKFQSAVKIALGDEIL